MTAPQTVFNVGDKVRHAERPEWGTGVVDQAVSIEHEGRPAQRLTVKFEHKGRTTLHTGFANVVAVNGSGNGHTPRPADAAPVVNAPTAPAAPSPNIPSAASGGWLATATGKPTTDVLMNLPEGATDPLASLARRLKFTLNLFRFSTEARSLIDWAVAQTGLYDPLTDFSRTDLETSFRYFAHKREQHLKELVRAIKRANQTALFRELDPLTPPAGRDALAKAIKSA